MKILVTGYKGFIGIQKYFYLKREFDVDGYSRGDSLKNVKYDCIIQAAAFTTSNIKNELEYILIQILYLHERLLKNILIHRLFIYLLEMYMENKILNIFLKRSKYVIVLFTACSSIQLKEQ
ncbi:hypothetical protein [Arcobacter sp. FWKO B]|uniref:hypothetical protein n=1 Tax=Arcobacter sp. FWKO B TaxID=2593672 RepID=UPI0018A4DC16|nr:hypothetical protein [Arcobacter sp. FWKO B]QOG12087.1 hypothetical protein FWKOB_04935 [Arcobacter sp. FWKO B]